MDTQISPLSSHRMMSRAEVCVPQGLITNVTLPPLVRMSGSAPGRSSMVGLARFMRCVRGNKRASVWSDVRLA